MSRTESPTVICFAISDGLVNRDATLVRKKVPQAFPVYVLHDHEKMVFPKRAKVEDRDDVAILEMNQSLRLAKEAGLHFRRCLVRTENFDGSEMFEKNVPGFVDLGRYSQIVLKHKNIFNRSKDDLAPCGKVEK